MQILTSEANRPGPLGAAELMSGDHQNIGVQISQIARNFTGSLDRIADKHTSGRVDKSGGLSDRLHDARLIIGCLQGQHNTTPTVGLK